MIPPVKAGPRGSPGGSWRQRVCRAVVADAPTRMSGVKAREASSPSSRCHASVSCGGGGQRRDAEKHLATKAIQKCHADALALDAAAGPGKRAFFPASVQSENRRCKEVPWLACLADPDAAQRLAQGGRQGRHIGPHLQGRQMGVWAPMENWRHGAVQSALRRKARHKGAACSALHASCQLSLTPTTPHLQQLVRPALQPLPNAVGLHL